MNITQYSYVIMMNINKHTVSLFMRLRGLSFVLVHRQMVRSTKRFIVTCMYSCSMVHVMHPGRLLPPSRHQHFSAFHWICFMYEVVSNHHIFLFSPPTTTCLLSTTYLLLYVCGLAGEFSLSCFMYKATSNHHISLFSPPICLWFKRWVFIELFYVWGCKQPPHISFSPPLCLWFRRWVFIELFYVWGYK